MSTREHPTRNYASVLGGLEKELTASPFAMPVREFLFLSQTNITTDPLLAFRHAIEGATAAQAQEVKKIDGTAEGEGWGKAGLNFMLGASALRTTLDGPTIIEKTRAFFSFSEESLKELLGTSVPKGRITRELAASHLLEGRAWSFAASNLATSRGEFDALTNLGMRAFDAALTQLDMSQAFSPRRFTTDPYRTQAYRHAAALARKSGSPLTSLRLAALGIGAAVRSGREQANHTSGPMDHSTYVLRQSGANAQEFINTLLAR